MDPHRKIVLRMKPPISRTLGWSPPLIPLFWSYWYGDPMDLPSLNDVVNPIIAAFVNPHRLNPRALTNSVSWTCPIVFPGNLLFLCANPGVGLSSYHLIYESDLVASFHSSEPFRRPSVQVVWSGLMSWLIVELPSSPSASSRNLTELWVTHCGWFWSQSLGTTRSWIGAHCLAIFDWGKSCGTDCGDTCEYGWVSWNNV